MTKRTRYLLCCDQLHILKFGGQTALFAIGSVRGRRRKRIQFDWITWFWLFGGSERRISAHGFGNGGHMIASHQMIGVIVLDLPSQFAQLTDTLSRQQHAYHTTVGFGFNLF